MSPVKDLSLLFYPKSICLVGASNNPTKWGCNVLHNLLMGGFEGTIYPINHKAGDVLGMKAYPSVLDLPETPDLAMICVPSDTVPQVIEDLITRNAKVAFIISSGFSEAGEPQSRMERDLASRAEQSGLILAGPNGQGLVCTGSKLYCLMAGVYNEEGPISIVSQSGNVGGTLMFNAYHHGFGINKFVSSGNEASVKLHDYIRYFGTDPTTRVILVYVENLKDGQAFLEACREVIPRKPIVLLRGGKTKEGASAAKSHTGAMATSTEIFDAACKQVGVLQVEDLNQMFQVATALAYQPLPTGNRLGIMTLGGGWGVLASDAASQCGLVLPKLSDQILREFSSFLPTFWSRNNPVDLVATRQPGSMTKVLEILARWDDVDALLMLGVGYGTRGLHMTQQSPFRDNPMMKMVADFVLQEDMSCAETIVRLIREVHKPILVCSDAVLGSRNIDNAPILHLERQNILVHPTPGDGAKTLSAMWQYAQFQQR